MEMESESEMESEKECVLRLDVFNTYWNILKRNYFDTQHTEKDFKLYYSIFREYEEKDFIKAIKLVLKYAHYFPRIDEIVQFLPVIDEEVKQTENIPKWFNNTPDSTIISKDEKTEISNLISELCEEKRDGE